MKVKETSRHLSRLEQIPDVLLQLLVGGVEADVLHDLPEQKEPG